MDKKITHGRLPFPFFPVILIFEGSFDGNGIRERGFGRTVIKGAR
jgi:hypothetical protein